MTAADDLAILIWRITLAFPVFSFPVMIGWLEAVTSHTSLGAVLALKVPEAPWPWQESPMTRRQCPANVEIRTGLTP